MEATMSCLSLEVLVDSPWPLLDIIPLTERDDGKENRNSYIIMGSILGYMLGFYCIAAHVRTCLAACLNPEDRQRRPLNTPSRCEEQASSLRVYRVCGAGFAVSGLGLRGLGVKPRPLKRRSCKRNP